MTVFLLALGLLIVGGLAALALSRAPRAATLAGAGSAVAASVLGLLAALTAWNGSRPAIRLPWAVPYGSFSLEIDPLSAFFLVPLFGLSGLAAVYGAEYLKSEAGRRRAGPPWFFFNLLIASMALVLTARNGVLFLVAWEVMALASFFLVTHDDDREEVRDAGWTYLVATHLGTAFLLAFFAILGGSAGTLDFDRLRAPAHSGALFILAVVGFGTKAGFMPLHVWLPEAHPAAPSHVSALMSGVMIKTGLYGLLRALGFLGAPPAWWGWLLVAIGALSAVGGIVSALAQRDLKRLLAYSSVENVGIIAMGLGLGFLGLSHRAPAVAALGFAGALLHVLNHALFKGMLFLCAGSVLHATGTRDLDRLGGLLKRMPATGAAFFVGAVAICGLPPLNGFAGEFLIYLGAFRGATGDAGGVALGSLGVIATLALVGGLTAACFAKAFGIAFLGEPRRAEADHAHESGMAMCVPPFLLAAGCVLVGATSPFLVAAMAPAIHVLGGLESAGALRQAALPPLRAVVHGSTVFALLALLLAVLRLALLKGRRVEQTVTWDCGYASPSSRMQYTSASFAQPLTDLFCFFLRPRRQLEAPAGPFPRKSSLETQMPDLFRQSVFAPAFAFSAWALSKLRWLQTGRVNMYVLYIAVTLLVLLAWKLA